MNSQMFKIARLFCTTAKLAPSQRVFQAFLGGKSTQSDSLRTKLTEELEKLRDNRARFEEMKGLIEDVTQVCFRNGDYKIMDRGHFQDLIRHPLSTQPLRYLLRTEFFMNNQSFVGNEEVVFAIESAKKKFERGPLLELIKYHEQFTTRMVGKKINMFQQEEDFLNFVKGIRKDDSADVISLCYHIYHLNTQNIMTTKVQDILIEELSNIRWTHQKQEGVQLKYQENLMNSLVKQKIKFGSNNNLRLFTVDLLLSSQSYPDLLKTASLYLLLLNRLDSNLCDVSDLLYGLQQTLGQDKFNFFFLNNFSETFQDKTRKALYLKGLESYQKSPSKEFVPQTQLDHHYQKGNQILVEHYYSNYAEPVFYHLKLKNQSKSVEQEKYLILRNDLQGLKALVSEKFGLPLTDNVIDEALRKIQNETILHQTTSPFRVTNTQEKTRLQQNKQRSNQSFNQNRSRSPRSQFSTQKETEEQGKESFGFGFLSYLKKNKQIDSGEEIPTPFSQIKSANSRQDNEKKILKAPEQIQTVFTPIRTKFFEKPITMTSNLTASENEDVQTAPLDNQNRKLEAQVKIRGSLKQPNPIETLQTLFSGYKQEDELLPYLIQVLLDINRNEQKNLLEKLFLNPPKNLPRNVPDADLKVVIDSQDGTLEKDYFKYIGEFTVFPYQLGQEVYDDLLRGLSENQGFSYKKFNFKKILTHIALFSTQLHETTFKLICGIIKDQKTPLTLLEGVTLFVKRGVVMNQNQIGQVMTILKRFRVYYEESDYLYAQAFKQYKWPLDNKTFSNHFNYLVEEQQTERHLNFYELIKDAQLEDIKKLNKQKQIEVREQYRAFALGYVDILLAKEQYEIAQKVLDDIKASKVTLNRTYHAMWIQSLAYDQVTARKYFENFTEKTPEEIDGEIITRLCTVVQKNSTKLKEFFGSVVSSHVFSGRINLTPEFINVMTNTFQQIKDISSLSNFAKLCADRNLTINYETKRIWVRFMKTTSDDNIKSELRQSLERIQIIEDNPRKQKKIQLQQEQRQPQIQEQTNPEGDKTQTIVPTGEESEESREFPTVIFCQQNKFQSLDPKQSRMTKKKGRFDRYNEFVQLNEDSNKHPSAKK